ncbi:MAG: hypothetical protein ACPGR7_08215 [Flavobacteriaceae bacterium]
MKKLLVLLLLLQACQTHDVKNSENFAEMIQGQWSGDMFIFNKGQIRDTVPVLFTVRETDTIDRWHWQMKYISEEFPITKDYRLELINAREQQYITDEGSGIILNSYRYKNKLYGFYTVSNTVFSATYELQGQDLIFEVYGGNPSKDSLKTDYKVHPYSVDFLQRVSLKKIQ